MNDAPTAAYLEQTLTLSEDADATALFQTKPLVTDPDSPAVKATLTLNADQGALKGAGAPANGVYTITGTPGEVSDKLGAVLFKPAADFSGFASVEVALTDSVAGTIPVVGKVTITVDPVDDGPTAENLTQSLVIAEDAAATPLFDIDSIIADPDSTVTATLTVSTAQGTLAGGAGTIDPQTGVYTVSGTPEAVNAALAAVTFTPKADFSGAVLVKVTVADESGAAPITGEVSITVTAVNDAPTADGLSQPLRLAADAAATHLFTTPPVVTDVDSPKLMATLQVDPTHGILAGNGGSFDATTGIYAMSGTPQEVNAALAAVTFTPKTGSSGDVEITVSVADEGDPIRAIMGKVSVTVAADETPPAPPIVALANGSDLALAFGETALVSFTFAEAPKDFDVSDVAVTNGKLEDFTARDGNPLVYTARLTAEGDGPITVTVPAGKFTDAAGNTSAAASNVLALTSDTAAPTATITLDDTILASSETAVVRIAFSEAVDGFNLDDLKADNGALDALTTSDNKTYTARFTPTEGAHDVDNVITLENAGVTDLAGNRGVGTTESQRYALDTQVPVAPTLFLAPDSNSGSPVDTLTNDPTPTLTGIAEAGSEVTILNGSNKVGTAHANAETGTFFFTSNELATGTTTTFSAVARDAAGNTSAASVPLTVTIDKVHPTVGVTFADAWLDNKDLVSDVRFAFSEEVIGFDTDDIKAVGGTLSALTRDGANPAVYIATFTADTNFVGSGSVSIANDTYGDEAGNVGSGGSNALSISTDSTSPTVSVAVSAATLNEDGTAEVTFTFSEPPQSFTAADVRVTHGTLGTIMPIEGSQVAFSAIFTPAADFQGDAEISIAANTVTDAAGNGNAASEIARIVVDAIDPSLKAIAPTGDAGAVDGGMSLMLTFSEEVRAGTGNFLITNTRDAADIRSIPITDPQVTISGATVTINPATDFASGGSYSVTFDAGVVTDLAGNPADAITDANALHFTMADTTPPAPPIIALLGTDAALSAGETASVIFTFAEAPIAFDAGDVKVTNGLLSDFKADSSNSKVYTATLTGTAEGMIDVSVAAGTFTDAAGNANTAASNTLSLTSNTAAPDAPTLVLAAESDTGTANDGITRDTTPTLTGAVEAGSTVEIFNGATLLGQATVTGTTFAFDAPTLANGERVLYTAKATDAAGNVSVVSDAVAVTIDTLATAAIVLDAVTTDNILNAGEAGESVAITGMVGGDAAEGDAVTLTVNGQTFTGAVASGNRFSVDVAGSALTADTTVSAGITGTDEAGNPFTASDTRIYTVDRASPVFQSAAVNGKGLVLTFDGVLDPAGVPDAGDFTIKVDGSAATVADVVVSGPTVTLTLAAPVANGQTVTMGYHDEAGNGADVIQDAAGNDAATITALPVTNNTPAGSPPNGGTPNGSTPGGGDGGGSDGGGGLITTPSPTPIQPTTGPDTLTGTTTSETIEAGLGNDQVAAGAGDDQVFGNQGDDQVFGNEGADRVFGGQGNDSAYGGKGDDGVQGNFGNDHVEGNKSNDEVLGNQGNDIVLGNEGDDFAHGGQGNDFVHGGQGNDQVNGGLGDDMVNGGLGDDVLTGGEGNDLFVFVTGQGSDVITDFGIGDLLDLQGQVYTLDAAEDGSVELILSGGGTIVLQGVTEAQFSAASVA